VALARRIGEGIGPFDLVLASHIPRTLETAIAMGFAVDEQLAALGEIAPDVVEEIGHHERWTWEAAFAIFAKFVAKSGPTARLGQRQQEAWVQAVESVPPGGNVLVISHGRIIKAGLVTCLPDGDFAGWGAALRHCEGARLQYEAGRFTEVSLLRVPSG
jgi:broad specificity phosphatase PhoE